MSINTSHARHILRRLRNFRRPDHKKTQIVPNISVVEYIAHHNGSQVTSSEQSGYAGKFIVDKNNSFRAPLLEKRLLSTAIGTWYATDLRIWVSGS